MSVALKFKNRAIDLLTQNGYKLTEQRQAVLTALSRMNNANSPYEIQKQLTKTGNPLSAVTIYRILDLFESMGIIHKISGRQGFVKCSIPHEEGCHHFMICQKCSRTTEFSEHDHGHEHSSHAHSPAIQKSKFKVLRHNLELYGLCRKCTQ